MLSPSLEALIKIFTKFPTIGPKTASRFAFYILEASEEEVKNLIKAIENLRRKIKTCSLCHKTFEDGNEQLCPICQNPARNKKIICVVEKEIDLEAIEKTKSFKGFYFILGGLLPLMHKENQNAKLEKEAEFLCQRIKKEKIEEVILALNPTLEGQNTALWLKRKLEPLKIKISQIAKGVPLGGEIEYADEETLIEAIANRK